MLHLSLNNWKTWDPKKEKTVALFIFQDQVPEWAKEDGFKGRELETLLHRAKSGLPAERVLLIGLGKKPDFSPETLRRAAAKVVRGAENMGLVKIAVRAPQVAKSSTAQAAEFQALAEGLYLATYRFDKHKTPADDTPKPVQDVTIWLLNSNRTIQDAVKKAEIYSQATTLVRDLVNEPPSLMNPERLAQEAVKLQKKSISVRVFEKKDLENMHMGGILGVGVGGAVPPRLIELHYKSSRKAKKSIALVGKGITFDSGGLSLKPALNMETMKMDMAGAATVLGVFSALADLKLPLDVRGYMAIAENMPGGRATKPGDVLKTFSGKTIEVLNTDAEGRLVLADALAYAASKKPDLMIDIATLTGACVVALGSSVSGVLGNTQSLVKALLQAGEKSGEKLWEMPLVKEYQEDIKSKVADVKNIGSRRGEAGTIIGGLFLQEFVNGSPWAHMDIAGPAWVDSDQPYCPTGATGHPVRTLLHYLESL